MSISAAAFAQRAIEKALQRPRIPYVLGGRSDAGTDCSNFLRLILRELGGKDIAAGSNAMWDAHVINRAFIHDGGTNKGGGFLVPGALMFMDYASPVNQTSAGTKGKMDHVGVYVGNVPGLIAENGKRGNVIHASRSVGFVAVSTLQNAWTHVAWLKGVDYGGGAAGLAGDGSGAAGAGGVVVELPASAASVGPGIGQAQVITTTSGLNLRRLPGKDGAKIKEMPPGTIVDVIRIEGMWANVQWNVRPGLYHTGWCCVGENEVEYLRFG